MSYSYNSSVVTNLVSMVPCTISKVKSYKQQKSIYHAITLSIGEQGNARSMLTIEP